MFWCHAHEQKLESEHVREYLCVCECVWVCEDVFQGDGQHVMVCQCVLCGGLM